MYSLSTTLMHSHTNPSLEQPMGEQLMSGSDQRAPQLAITDPKVYRSDQRTPQLAITDPKVCRSYLVDTPQLAITDPKVCRSYLVGNCPHDLFTNTKNKLGSWFWSSAMGKNYNSVSGSTQGNMPVSSAQDAARSLPPGRATAHRPPPTALTHPSTNTKNELGPCPKVHNEALKTMGEAKIPVAPPLPQHEPSALVSVSSGGGWG